MVALGAGTPGGERDLLRLGRDAHVDPERRAELRQRRRHVEFPRAGGDLEHDDGVVAGILAHPDPGGEPPVLLLAPVRRLARTGHGEGALVELAVDAVVTAVPVRAAGLAPGNVDARRRRPVGVRLDRELERRTGDGPGTGRGGRGGGQQRRQQKNKTWKFELRIPGLVHKPASPGNKGWVAAASAVLGACRWFCPFAIGKACAEPSALPLPPGRVSRLEPG